MLWWVFILVGAILLLRGHRMIKIVGALIGALAGLIATDFLFQAMPTLLEYENEVKIGLVIFGAILMHSMLLVAIRSVAGLGVFVAFSSLVLALQEEGYVIEHNHSNLVGIGFSFDWTAGTKYKAPEFVANIGLEWLFRLIQEPKRLYKRYLIDNTLFILYFLRQVFFHR